MNKGKGKAKAKAKNKMTINYKLIAAILILIVAVALIIVFASKAVKSSRKNKDTVKVLKFESYSNDIKTSTLNVEIKNKKVNDVAVTIIYDNEEIAKEVFQIFKDEGEYTNVALEGNSVVMHYNSKDISNLQNLTQKEIIESFELQGYNYIK